MASLEARLPCANRRPKFLLEELPVLSLAKRGAALLSCFVLLTVVWVAVAEKMLNPPMYLQLARCSTAEDLDAGAGAPKAPPATKMPFGANLDRCIHGTNVTLGDKDVLPIRYRLQFQVKNGTLDRTVIKARGVRVGGTNARHPNLKINVGACAEKSCNFPTVVESSATAVGGDPTFELYHDLAYTSTRSPKLDWDIQFGIVADRVPAALGFAVDSFSVYIQTTNRSFVYQELVVRWIFIIAAGIVATVFYYKLAFARMNYPWRAWALEQKWTFILLALLIGFNNPLMFLFLNSDESKDFGIFVDVSLRYTFLMGYFMALLCMTDHMAQTKKKSTRDFYLPKFLLLAPCWAILIINTVVSRAHHELQNVAIVAYLSVVLGIYILWLFFLIVLMMHKAQTDSTSALKVSGRFKLLWTVNVLMIAGFAAALYRINVWGQDGTEFVLGYAGFNFYVYFLAMLFIPAVSSMPYRPPVQQPEASAEAGLGDVEINDEYEVDGDY